MWNYEKRLIHPVKVKRPDPQAATVIMTQLGGPRCAKLYLFREKIKAEDYSSAFTLSKSRENSEKRSGVGTGSISNLFVGKMEQLLPFLY